jgi:archaellum component FlaC
MEGLQVEWETDADTSERTQKAEWSMDYGPNHENTQSGSEWSKYNEQFQMRDERTVNPNLRQRTGRTAHATNDSSVDAGSSKSSGQFDEPVIDSKRLDELKLRVRSRELKKRVESIMNCYYVVITVGYRF